MLKNIKSSLILRGVLFAAVGILCLASPKGTLTSLAWVIGALLLVAAVVTFFVSRNRVAGRMEPMRLIAAILMAVVGLLVIIRPQIIAILLGVFIFFEGIDFTVTAIRYRRAEVRHWWLLLTISLLVAIFGLWAICTPWVGATLLSLIIGIGTLGIAIDCFAALIGIGRVENFFARLKEPASSKGTGESGFEEAQVVED